MSGRKRTREKLSTEDGMYQITALRRDGRPFDEANLGDTGTVTVFSREELDLQIQAVETWGPEWTYTIRACGGSKL